MSRSSEDLVNKSDGDTGGSGVEETRRGVESRLFLWKDIASTNTVRRRILMNNCLRIMGIYFNIL